jgi:long-chain acyl-CoA synthetase
MADRVAAGLVAFGVQPGQVVSIHSPNRWEWIASYHGVLRTGAIVNPMNSMLTVEETSFVLNDCEAVALFTTSEHASHLMSNRESMGGMFNMITYDERVEGATTFDELTRNEGKVPVFEIDPQSASTIAYTSGTTGFPKGAIQSHQAVLLNCALTATMHGRVPSDIVVTALPAPHVYGNVAINGTFLAGGVVVLMERFSPTIALSLIGEHRATMFEGVPAMYSMMLADPGIETAELHSLTRSTVGGQTIPVSTIKRWEERSGAPLIELWGMTEIAGLGTTHAVYAPSLPGSIGVSLPGIEVRIADLEDTSLTVPPGAVGELMIRGPIVMEGYFNNTEATAKAIEVDGWLHTGDIATMNETGHVFIVDRLKDLIITGGYNIYPAEIERVLSSHPGVALVAVGSVPDEVKGELACAYVVRNTVEVTESELMEFAAEHLAAYKRPRMVRFVEDLPKTSSGKVMRRELINLFIP